MRLIPILLAVVAAGVLGAAQAQLDIEVATQAESYTSGDAIIIHGTVTTIQEKTPVIIKISFGTTTIEVAQVLVSQDKKFVHTTLAEGAKWNRDGAYTVEASYNAGAGVGATAVSDFDFFATDSGEDGTYEVDGGTAGPFSVGYTITGGTVGRIQLDYYNYALITDIDADDSGNVILELPRAYIDARTSGCEGEDDVFIVLVDGVEVPYDTVKRSESSQTLRVYFLDGSSEIVIIGTCIVPEFGAAMLVMAAAIGIIILAGSRIRTFP